MFSVSFINHGGGGGGQKKIGMFYPCTVYLCSVQGYLFSYQNVISKASIVKKSWFANRKVNWNMVLKDIKKT